MEEKVQLNSVIENVKGYLDTKGELIKLNTSVKVAEISAYTVVLLLFFFVFNIIALLLSFALAFWLADISGSNAKGFALAAAVYVLFLLLTSGIFYAFRKRIISNISEAIYNQLNPDENNE